MVLYKPSRANLDSSRPIVIDLLEDTPRPTMRHLQPKAAGAANVQIVLSDDSDDVLELAEGPVRKRMKGRPSPTPAGSGIGSLAFQHVEASTATAKAVVGPDSIVFGSPIVSAFPRQVRRVHKATAPSNEDLDGLTILSDLTNSSQPHMNMHMKLSDRTAMLLAALKGSSSRDQNENSASPNAGKAAVGPTFENCIQLSSKRKENGRGDHTNLTDILANPPKKARNNSAAKRDRAREKERIRIVREASKEMEKANREKLKQLRALEKEIASELASANRLKTDKRISTLEMIVDLPYSLKGSAVGDQIQKFLKNIQVEVGFVNPCPIPNVISWRRKATARYNMDLGYWEPIQEEIVDEKHVMCLVSAEEFVEMAQTGPNDVAGRDIDTHVLRLKSKFEGCSPIYLIEGLSAWMRKNRNVRNRAFQAAVLYHGDENTGQSGSQVIGSRRRKSVQKYVDADLIEDALLKLQVVHKCLIHHTASAMETAEWVSNFTQHISTIPYRCVK
jgi:crossover junction endonuclease EME1